MPRNKPKEKPVEAGKLNYVSPSSMSRALSCLRSYHFRYVQGVPDPPGKNAEVGTEAHEQIEQYILGGPDLLGDVARKWKPTADFAMRSGSHNAVEMHVVGYYINRTRVVGYIDLVRSFCTSALDSRFEPFDFKGVEINDWKAKGNMDLRWQLRGQKLIDDIQMGVYGDFAYKKLSAPNVLLAHTYGQIGGKDSARSVVEASEASLQPTVAKCEGIVDDIRRIIKLPIAEVPANRDHCDSYGGCPYYKLCPKSSLLDLGDGVVFDKKHKEKKMNAKERIAQAKAAAAAAAAAAVASEKAALLAEEEGSNEEGEDLEWVLGAFDDPAIGMPRLGGQAEAEWQKLSGKRPPSPCGPLGASPTVTSWADLVDLAREMTGDEVEEEEIDDAPVAKPAAEEMPDFLKDGAPDEVAVPMVKKSDAPAISPPDAPPSMPHLAADPVGDLEPPPAPAPECLREEVQTETPDSDTARTAEWLGECKGKSKPDLIQMVLGECDRWRLPVTLRSIVGIGVGKLKMDGLKDAYVALKGQDEGPVEMSADAEKLRGALKAFDTAMQALAEAIQ